MTSSLSSLVNNVSEGIYKIKFKYGHNEKKCEIFKIKCKYCNCFLKYTIFKDYLIENKCLCFNENYKKSFDKNFKKRFFNTHKFPTIITITLFYF